MPAAAGRPSAPPRGRGCPSAVPADRGARPLRPSGRRLAWLLVGLCGGLLAGAPPAAATIAEVSPVTGVAASSASTGADGTVRGVVERVAVEEGDPARDRRDDATAGTTTWITEGERRVQVPVSALADVPTGAAVEARLGPAVPSGTDTVRTVTSLTVLRTVTASAAAPIGRASAAHAVTVMLALPAKSRADTMTTERLTSAVTNGAARFWSRESGGRITFAVTRAVGWTRLTHDCGDVWGLWDEARSRSAFTPGTRRHLLLYVPPGAGCPNGLSTVAPSPDAGGYSLVGGSAAGLLAHELGHNLGLGHSDALTCDGVADAGYRGQWPAGCTHEDYGDWYDVMGITWDNLGTLSTSHAYRLGLLGAGEVLSVRGPARAVLRPVSGHAGLRSLRIIDPGGGVYVVEYRPASGGDAWLGTAANWRGLRPGVLVRRVDPQDPIRTLLLDATPSPAARAAGDTDSPLPPGATLSTASGRMTIRVDAVTAGAATVVVAMDGVSPAFVVRPLRRLVNGTQVTIANAPAAWAAAGGY